MKDYEGLYQISSFGRVKSIDRIVGCGNGFKLLKGKVLKPDYIESNRKRIRLRKNGKNKNHPVARIVALSFLKNELNLSDVNHKDEDPSNDYVGNLEWCTHKYNMNYGTRTERQRKHVCRAVIQYDKNGNIIKEWESAISTNEFGFSSRNISACCKFKRKTHKKFIWRYADEELCSKRKPHTYKK